MVLLFWRQWNVREGERKTIVDIGNGGLTDQLLMLEEEEEEE